MRIGIDIRKYNDFGIGTYIQNLLVEYSKCTDIELTLFATPEQILQHRERMRGIFIAENSTKYSVQELFSLSRKANGTNIDLLHEPHYTLPLNLRKKSVVTIHDLIHLKMPKYFSFSKKLYASLMLRHACRDSTYVIVDSNFTKKDIFKSFDIDEKKITSIPLGVDQAFSIEVEGQKKETFKRKYNIVKPYILYTGSLKPHKNIPLLLGAFEIIRKQIDVQLVLAGENVNDYPAIVALLKTWEITDSVIGVGRLSQQELATAYQSSEAVVLPSLYEGFGFSMLEAMASGVFWKLRSRVCMFIGLC